VVTATAPSGGILIAPLGLMKNARILSTLLLAGAASACASINNGGSLVHAPRFREADDQRAQLSFSSSESPRTATLRVFAEVRNPNSTKLKLSKVKGSLFLDGQKAGEVDLELDLDMKPRQETAVPFDVEVPLDKAPALAQTLARSAEGPAVGYRVDGSMSVETDQGQPVFGPLTLLEGEARVR
jgi:LEA14-like dessication related protein